MTTLNYLDDFQPGQVFRSPGTLTVSAEEIKQFAQQYDPQPFHLDDAAAQQTFFRGLAASGWHTAALTMRLLVDTLHIQGGIIGAGFVAPHLPSVVVAGIMVAVAVICWWSARLRMTQA